MNKKNVVMKTIVIYPIEDENYFVYKSGSEDGLGYYSAHMQNGFMVEYKGKDIKGESQGLFDVSGEINRILKENGYDDVRVVVDRSQYWFNGKLEKEPVDCPF